MLVFHRLQPLFATHKDTHHQITPREHSLFLTYHSFTVQLHLGQGEALIHKPQFKTQAELLVNVGQDEQESTGVVTTSLPPFSLPFQPLVSRC